MASALETGHTVVRFEVGQRVVCVDAMHTNITHTPELVDGEIYTVAWVGPYTEPPSHGGSQGIAVKVMECRVQPGDPPFWARRFRPVTDITLFESMLIHAPVRDVEPV